jgi:hypothetical protein
LQIHATLASTAADKSPREEADFAFSHAWGLLLLVIKYQNILFPLGLDEDIAACEREVAEVWRPT